MTATTVSTTDAVWAAVKAANAGDVITLAAGKYAALTLSGFIKDGVTIKGAGAVLGALTVTNCQGLNFDGLEVAQADTSTGHYANAISGSSKIAFANMNVHTATGVLSGIGFFIRNSSEISVKASELHHLGVGMSIIDSPNCTVTGNTFHDINTDGIDNAGAPGVTIVGNHFTDFYPDVGAHPDAIQFWPTAANPRPSGAVVKDNVIVRGKGRVMQGIFVAGQDNITITGNAMAGTMYNGISLSGVNTALIADNFVQGFVDMGADIMVRGGSTKVVCRDNTCSQAPTTYAGATEAVVKPEDYLISGTVMIPAAQVGDLSALNAWLAAKAGATATPPPVTPPPVADPRDATIADLTAELSAANAATVAAQTAASTAQRTLADYQAAQATKIAALQAQFDAAEAKIAAAEAALA